MWLWSCSRSDAGAAIFGAGVVVDDVGVGIKGVGTKGVVVEVFFVVRVLVENRYEYRHSFIL